MNLVKKALKAREATSLLFLVALFVIVSLINRLSHRLKTSLRSLTPRWFTS